MRKKYLVSVTLMTLYLLLMFHLLDPKDFRAIMIDRVIDTGDRFRDRDRIRLPDRPGLGT
jgi:hypothetical protein